MSDYRRLISYIYEYEGKTKGKNVGFVKLEARNGQCRIQVNVKQMFVSGNSIGVYLLGKGEKKTLLGNMFARNGIGEFRTIVDAVNVEGTGDGMDTYYGLTVHDVKNAWRSYRTIWEDVEIVETANLQQSESVQSEATRSEVIRSESMKSELLQSEPAQLEPAHPDSIQPKSVHIESVNTGVKDPATINASETADVRAAELAEVKTTKMTDVDATEAVYVQETTDGETQEESVEKSDEMVQEETAQGIAVEENMQETETFNETSVPSAIVSPELENPEVLQYLQETEQKPNNPEALWQELRKTYPKIQPFDYDGESEVLTIRPDDIGHLPRENWIYGNNSFLMHGYYNFRYLILVRLTQPGKRSRYLLGVPGHYYSNEKYMANMFGFPNFVLSKKQPPNDGRFGYWYTDVKMN